MEHEIGPESEPVQKRFDVAEDLVARPACGACAAPLSMNRRQKTFMTGSTIYQARACITEYLAQQHEAPACARHHRAHRLDLSDFETIGPFLCKSG